MDRYYYDPNSEEVLSEQDMAGRMDISDEPMSWGEISEAEEKWLENHIEENSLVVFEARNGEFFSREQLRPLTYEQVEDYVEESLNENVEPLKVGYLEVPAGKAVRAADPIAFSEIVRDFIDSEFEEIL